jgi:hypothetical protein
MKLIFALFISCACLAQDFKSFQGRLVYSVEMEDTSLQLLFPKKHMVVYTNDTIVRIENETKTLGKQVVLKHTVLQKSYLLLSNGENKYAIQSSKEETVSAKNYPYTFKKKRGKCKIAEIKANRLIVTHADFKKPYTFLYLKKYSSKYVDAFDNIPGLPVKYFLSTPDGVVVYTLESMEESPVLEDLFGIPSNYKRVSFDEFLEEMIPKE